MAGNLIFLAKGGKNMVKKIKRDKGQGGKLVAILGERMVARGSKKNVWTELFAFCDAKIKPRSEEECDKIYRELIREMNDK